MEDEEDEEDDDEKIFEAFLNVTANCMQCFVCLFNPQLQGFFYYKIKSTNQDLFYSQIDHQSYVQK